MKFIKEERHRGGSIPFWDFSFSAKLVIDFANKTLVLDAFDLIELKALLQEFDGRNGRWKEKREQP